MSVVAIIQARMGSTRLPGKVLLPICGVPVAVLAAKRAQRNGYEVRMATSADSSDDILVKVVEEAGIPVVRGSLEDVLDRFVQATADLPNDALLVRLTADNVFPDADFIDMIVDEFLGTTDASLVATTPESGLPYGLSAEVFRCGALREAAANAVTRYEREHVTPWVKSAYGVGSIRVPDAPGGWGGLRCTIDTLSDYERVWNVFAVHGGDPVSIPWRALCETLAEISPERVVRVPIHEVSGRPHSVLVLGTAQLGLEYGRANTRGLPSEEEASRIVEEAIGHGVTHVDTARAYGDSERRIGRVLERGYRNALTVVTKLDPLDGLPPDAPDYCARYAVDASVFRSCRELRTSHLDTVLLHRANHMDSYNGALWARLRELRGAGVLGVLGVSVESVAEAKRALANPDVQHLQLPFNILDRRWLDTALQESLKTRPDVVVHARSPLLQGLLAEAEHKLWPEVPGVDPSLIRSQLGALVDRLGRRDVVDLALAYVRGQEWIHGVVLGVERLEQLIDAAQLMCTPALTPAECKLVEQEIEGGPEALVNPALWDSRE